MSHRRCARSSRLSAVGLVVIGALTLSACGLEAQDETSREHSQVQAAGFSVGQVEVRDAYLSYEPAAVPTTAPTPASSATPAPAIAAQQQGFLSVTFVNHGAADSLTSVTTPLGTVSLAEPAGSATSASGSTIALPAGVPVSLGVPAPDSTTPSLAITGGSGSPAPVGSTVPMTFAFANAGTSGTIQVPVVPPGQSTAPTQAVPTGTATIPTPSTGG